MKSRFKLAFLLALISSALAVPALGDTFGISRVLKPNQPKIPLSSNKASPLNIGTTENAEGLQGAIPVIKGPVSLQAKVGQSAPLARFMVYNSGSAPLSISTVTLKDMATDVGFTGAGKFEVLNNTCNGSELKPTDFLKLQTNLSKDKYCSFSLKYSPSVSGLLRSAIVLSGNIPPELSSIVITGKGF